MEIGYYSARQCCIAVEGSVSYRNIDGEVNNCVGEYSA